jgi:uncharacterized protein
VWSLAADCGVGQAEETLMAQVPPLIAEFLSGKRVAIAGVSRGASSAANPVYRKLRDCGYEVFPVNPNASEVEGAKCYPDLANIPGKLDGVVIATHPGVSAQIVRQAIDQQVRRIWFHRSFGDGSVSATAVQECAREDIPCIVGGCPLMYCEPVDCWHRWMRAWLGWRGRLPR